MTSISTDELRTEINAILKTADLSVISAKKVREQVEEKLKCSLINRKKEIDSIVMEFIEQQNDEDEEDGDDGGDKDASDGGGKESASEEEASSEEEKKKKPAKRPKPTARKSSSQKKKRKSLNASDSGSESDGGSDSDYEQPKKTKAAAKKKSGGGGGGGATTGRKSTGFTRPYNLSPELSNLMGAESLPRHEVVKKVWAIIKERNLYDPKNKQFAICDDELMKVMGVKRFRTFAMLKYLKPHFMN